METERVLGTWKPWYPLFTFFILQKFIFFYIDDHEDKIYICYKLDFSIHHHFSHITYDWWSLAPSFVLIHWCTDSICDIMDLSESFWRYKELEISGH